MHPTVHSNLDWAGLFAGRAALTRRSTVREFLKHAARPGMISFAGGLPAPELFPAKAVRHAAETVLARHAAQALQYGETEGVPALRDWLARRHGVAPENVLITSGAQQALDLLGRVFVNPGDRVLVENPTYLALLSAWRPFGAVFQAADSDGDGMEVDAASAAGAKLAYVVPNFQNPQGTTLALERRHALIRLAADLGMVIVEDDPYGELRYEGAAQPSLLELAGIGGPVIRVGTVSKILAPGFRLGWVIAAAPVIQQLVSAKQAMDLHTSTFNQMIVLHLLEAGEVEKQLPILRQEYRARRDAMLTALGSNMPAGVTWTRPAGGMFLLAALPPARGARELAQAGLEAKVIIVPGDDFHVQGGANTFRLNFSNAQPAQIEIGIARLAVLARQHLESCVQGGRQFCKRPKHGAIE